ncbi:MAG: F-type H+-transporting ATPase subunit epsilon [Patescibacteria group bacterium]|jgi:F-type H+-transporting ATPase subunit epsilon|nr:F-type H+-transporting ATPase subunit epsilon [Patescibacteria group bacterium]
MQLKVVTPEKVIYDGEIDELIIPTVTGEIAVLPHHIDLLTQVVPGEMTIKHKGKDQHVAVTGGFLQIVDGVLTLLSDYAVRSEEIDAKKALEAQKRAEETLKKKKEDLTERDFAVAQADMRRAILELKVANKRRSHRTQL